MSIRALWGRLGVLLAAACLAGCAPGEAGPARHLVLVSIDALGARHVGAYGHERDTTPNLDAVAAAGTLFESAYTQQLWTLTSHLTMLTGLAPQAHGAGHERPARTGIVTLAQHLKRAGFETGAFVGAGGYMDPRFGLGRGFQTYVTRGANEQLDNTAAFAWLRAQAARAKQRPEHRFFLFLHYYDVHSDAGTPVPYDSPDRRRFMPDGLHWRHPGDTAALGRLHRSGDVTEDDRTALHALYDAGVHFVDERATGQLAALLASLGLADETLLVVTSDHGDELFEHGSFSHQQPYDEAARVPLVLRGPGVPAGVRVDGLAALVDLLPTSMRLLGFEPPESVQGRDLTPLLAGGEPVRDSVFVDGIMTGYRHYRSAAVADIGESRFAWIGHIEAPRAHGRRMFRHVPPAELYDLRADPEQQRDLAAARPELAAELERRLLAWYVESEKRALGLGAVRRERILSDEERENLRALGYVEE